MRAAPAPRDVYKENRMQVNIQSRGIEVPTKFRNYVNQRIERLHRYLPGLEDVRVKVRKDGHTDDAVKAIELTIHRKRTMLRSEEFASDIFAGFDLALDKMHHRIAKYKGRRIDAKRAGVHIDEELADAEALPVDAPDDDAPTRVVRTKTFSVVPMDTDEAIEQMELIGHTFFIFQHAESGQMNVVYKRKAGDYGLMQPEK
jgi:putative sigma-54 modulation protein